MAFKLKLQERCSTSCGCIECNTITVYDGSGIYNASTNPTGYGTPNIQYTEVSVATLTLYSPTGELVQTIDVSNYYDNINSLGTDMVITNLDGNFSDGLWNVELVIQGITGEGEETANFRYSSTIAVWIDCNTRICIAKLVSDIDPDCDCGCKDDKNEKYINAMIYLDAAKLAASQNCCNYAKANKLLAAAKAICEANCNDC